MATQEELDKCYMSTSVAHANISKAIRKKVGCALVTQSGTILAGCNGMAPSGSNSLEERKYMNVDEGGWLDYDLILEKYPYVDQEGKRYTFVSKEHVIHAELSCILRAAKEGVSVVGSTLYTTLSCCLRCSEMVAAAGVKRVVYKEEYRDTRGIENLKSLGVIVEKMEE